MDTLTHILNGFAVCLQPINLWYTFLGVFLGTIIGVLPGHRSVRRHRAADSRHVRNEPDVRLIMMAGIYYGTKYGGSTTSILIRTPGEAASVMTSIDGYEMAKNGRARRGARGFGNRLVHRRHARRRRAHAVRAAADVDGAKFGPAEYFTLMVFAMTACRSLAGASPAKGMLSTILGLMIATIGIDLQSGQPRYTMGVAGVPGRRRFRRRGGGLVRVSRGVPRHGRRSRALRPR